MRFYAANNWQTELAENIDHLDTLFNVSDASGHPAVPFKISVEDEIMNVTDVTNDTLTVQRGQEDTEAVSHDTGAMVQNRFTAETINAFWDEFESHLTDFLAHVHSGGEGEPPNVPWDNVSNKPTEFTPEAHTHDASNIDSGTLNTARIPTITHDMTDFADQALNKASSPEFAYLKIENDGLTLNLNTSGSPFLRFDMGGSGTTGEYRMYSWGSSRTLCIEHMGDVAVVIDYNNNMTNKAFRVLHDGEGVAGTELFRVQEDGRVGIGTDSPGARLHVTGDPGADNFGANIERDNLIGIDNAVLRVYMDTAVTTRYLFRADNRNGTQVVIDGGGNVGIGETSPSYKLDVVGDINAEDKYYIDGTKLSEGHFELQDTPGSTANEDVSWSTSYASSPIVVAQVFENVTRSLGAYTRTVSTTAAGLRSWRDSDFYAYVKVCIASLET